jgi:hypothetical protein
VLGNQALHGRHDVEVEKAVPQPGAQLLVRILRDQAHLSGMSLLDMLDHDRGFGNDLVSILKKGNFRGWPQRLECRLRLRIAEIDHSGVEGSSVLVEGNQNLPAVGGQGVGMECQGHDAFNSFLTG